MFELVAALAALSIQPAVTVIPTQPTPETVVEPAPVAEATYWPEAGALSVRCTAPRCDLVIEVTEVTGPWIVVVINDRGFNLRSDVPNLVALPVSPERRTYSIRVYSARISIRATVPEPIRVVQTTGASP